MPKQPFAWQHRPGPTDPAALLRTQKGLPAHNEGEAESRPDWGLIHDTSAGGEMFQWLGCQLFSERSLGTRARGARATAARRGEV